MIGDRIPEDDAKHRFMRRYLAMIAVARESTDGASPAPAPEPLDFNRSDITFDRSDITFDDTEA